MKNKRPDVSTRPLDNGISSRITLLLLFFALLPFLLRRPDQGELAVFTGKKSGTGFEFMIRLIDKLLPPQPDRKKQAAKTAAGRGGHRPIRILSGHPS